MKQFMKQKVTDEVLLEMRTESGILRYVSFELIITLKKSHFPSLSAIEHPNIIKFLGMCIKIPHLCIVTELLERGSLSTVSAIIVILFILVTKYDTICSMTIYMYYWETTIYPGHKRRVLLLTLLGDWSIYITTILFIET